MWHLKMTEEALAVLQTEIRQAENNLQQQQQNEHQYRQRVTAQQQQQLVARLQSQFNLLFDNSLNVRLQQAEAEFVACQSAQQFLDQHDKACLKLKPHLDALREDLAAFDEFAASQFCC